MTPVATVLSDDGLRAATVGGDAPAPPPFEWQIARVHSDLPALATAEPRLARHVTASLTSAMAERRKRVANVRACLDMRLSAPTLSKDMSERPTTIIAAVDDDPVSLRFVKGFLRAAAREGFDVLVAATPETLARDFADVHAQVRRFGVLAPAIWTEDMVLADRDGGLKLTPQLSTGVLPSGAMSQTSVDLVAAQIRDRMRRQLPDSACPSLRTESEVRAAIKAYPEVSYWFEGMTDHAATMSVAGALGILAGRRVEASITYVEGGNLISGRRGDGSPYAVVGADTIAINRELFAEQPGGPLTDDETRRLVARDVGVPAEGLIVMRQPGAFHIDMAMAGWERGTVLLNDARAAFAVQEAVMRADAPGAMTEAQLTAMARLAHNRAALEDGAASDLAAGGLRVVRAPGRFMRPNAPEKDIANLLNGEAGVGNSGQYFVTAGAPVWAEQAFLRAVHAGSCSPVTVYFATTPADAASSLSLNGSMNCRCCRIG